MVALPLCFVPILSPDLPWHLAAARWIVAHGALPRTDFLSWSKAGVPWTDFEWGTELIYWLLDKADGLRALWLFKSFVFIGLLGVNLALLALWELPLTWMGFAVPVLILSLLPNLDLRPENLTLLFFSLQLLALEARRLRKFRGSDAAFAGLHFAAYAVWANLHAGFVTGLTLIGFYGVGAFLEAAMPRVYDAEASVDLTTLKPWAFAGVAGFFGTLVNPSGLDIYRVTFAHYNQLQLLQTYINEWQAPSVFSIAQWPYWTLILFCFTVSAVHFARTKKTPYAHLFALFFFGLNSASYSRNTAFFCLSAFPYSVLALHDLEAPAWWRTARLYVMSPAFVALAVAMHTLFRMPGAYKRTHMDTHRPEYACDYLQREKAALSRLRLYNPWAWGGYIDWRLSPDYPVFVDGRYLFHEYLPVISEVQKDPALWKKFLDDQGMSLILVENRNDFYQDPQYPKETVWRPLVRMFLPKETWALVYWDPKALLFVRRAKAPPDWLKAHEFRWLFPKDQQFLERQLAQGSVTLDAVKKEAERYSEQARVPETEQGIAVWLAKVSPRPAAPKAPSVR